MVDVLFSSIAPFAAPLVERFFGAGLDMLQAEVSTLVRQAAGSATGTLKAAAKLVAENVFKALGAGDVAFVQQLKLSYIEASNRAMERLPGMKLTELAGLWEGLKDPTRLFVAYTKQVVELSSQYEELVEPLKTVEHAPGHLSQNSFTTLGVRVDGYSGLALVEVEQGIVSPSVKSFRFSKWVPKTALTPLIMERSSKLAGFLALERGSDGLPVLDPLMIRDLDREQKGVTRYPLDGPAEPNLVLGQ